ncbi:MAG: pyrroloquinoline quinone biosynthesis peptide chaperone PqqD [Burkholderiales bacterium]
MSEKPPLGMETVVQIPRLYRLQWEQAQNAYVLLYPEGMIKLNQAAGEILKRVDGESTISDIVKNLETAFPGANLRDDVLQFMEIAHGKGWIKPKQ